MEGQLVTYYGLVTCYGPVVDSVLLVINESFSRLMLVLYNYLGSHFRVVLCGVISHFLVLYKSCAQLQQLLNWSEISVQIQLCQRKLYVPI
jgi:hypothetical protein